MATKSSKSTSKKSSSKGTQEKKKESKKAKSSDKKKGEQSELETDHESDVQPTERNINPQLMLSQTARQDLKSRFNELPDTDFQGTKDEVISRISLKTKLPVKDLEAYIAGR